MLKHFSISVEAGVVSICLSDRKRADDVNTKSDRHLKTVCMHVVDRIYILELL